MTDTERLLLVTIARATMLLLVADKFRRTTRSSNLWGGWTTGPTPQDLKLRKSYDDVIDDIGRQIQKIAGEQPVSNRNRFLALLGDLF